MVPDLDLTTMTNDDIDTYAAEQIAVCRVPGEDPTGLAQALRNLVARDKALRDPFWADLVSQEAAAFREREPQAARERHEEWEQS